ncbi:MAG: acyltransferase [Prevotella sp.]|nr:acyltransferase [Prevotella sp.]
MSNTIIFCMNEIVIGDYVNIGGQCLIMDSNFHSLNWEERMIPEDDKKNARTAPVHIGSHVFIGARTIICKGVTIGDKAIVSAGSVVVCNIPPLEIWGGNPAKFIKRLE